MTNNLPTVDIKGKEYVLVKDRILAFNEIYLNGSIETQLISEPTAETIIVKATVTPDVNNPNRKFSDYSQAKIGQGMVNMTAALENASTSAVGRALAYMGIGVIESIASADEVVKAIANEPVKVERPNSKMPKMPVPTDGERICRNCQSSRFILKQSGPTASRPNEWYIKCDDCGEFYRYLSKEEQND